MIFLREHASEWPAFAERSRDLAVAREIPTSIPRYILAARVSLLMRGTAQLMAQRSLRTARAWRQSAERAVRQPEPLPPPPWASLRGALQDIEGGFGLYIL